MARFIALYLPQYHPFEQNDEWWGKGFTEWVNVSRARPLFKGHIQPHIPRDLGFYDLRLPEIRQQQVELAMEAGVESFCYYDYWFGDNYRLMERPFEEVVRSGEPDFPFCCCWANASWYNKKWDPKAPDKDKLLIEQKYGGVEDYTAHFMALLPAFKDKRYTRVNGKLFFMITGPMDFDSALFIRTWRQLAKDNNLGDFYFVGMTADSRNKNEIISKGYDAICNIDLLNIHHNLSFIQKISLMLYRKYLHIPTKFRYKDAIKFMINKDCVDRDVIPSIAPNWDHSPRSGKQSIILTGSTPNLFQELAENSIKVVSGKPKDEQIIIIKSWNEWGEGNYMEPDLEFGHGYLHALRNAINNFK